MIYFAQYIASHRVMENDINIDFADYQTILSHRGRVDGLVGSCKVEDKMLRFEMVS